MSTNLGKKHVAAITLIPSVPPEDVYKENQCQCFKGPSNVRSQPALSARWILQFSTPNSLIKCQKQGDQIGRFFAYWVIVISG
jgi:hypothetical protein